MAIESQASWFGTAPIYPASTLIASDRGENEAPGRRRLQTSKPPARHCEPSRLMDRDLSPPALSTDPTGIPHPGSRVVPLLALAHNIGESFGMLPLDDWLPAPILTERLLDMDEISLRALEPADAGEAARVIRTAFAAQPRLTEPPSSALSETALSVSAKIAAGGGIGAFASGTLVAAILWEIKAGALHVGRVSVAPAWRGRRLAGALIKGCESEARRRGLARMTLRVRLELPENERLFERFGFERRAIGAHDGFDEPTMAMMEKRLA
jgi:predicted N-acetyltransferase YhbS